MNLNYVGSYIYSPHWTKIKKATIDPVNKKNNKCFVGAPGFCAESVRSCLRSLGFNNKLCRKTLQTLSSVSLRYSFGCVEILKAGLYPIQYLCLTQNRHRKSLT